MSQRCYNTPEIELHIVAAEAGFAASQSGDLEAIYGEKEEGAW